MKFKRRKSDLNLREESLQAREKKVTNGEKTLRTKVDEMKSNVDKINADREKAIELYNEAPIGRSELSKEINLEAARRAAKFNNSDALLRWFNSVKDSLLETLQKAKFVAKQFFSKSADEMQDVVNSMRRNGSNSFGEYVDLRICGKTLEQIEQRKRLEKQGRQIQSSMSW